MAKAAKAKSKSKSGAPKAVVKKNTPVAAAPAIVDSIAKKTSKPTVYRSININMTLEEEELHSKEAEAAADLVTRVANARETAHPLPKAKVLKGTPQKPSKEFDYKGMVKRVVKIDLDAPPATEKKAEETPIRESDAYKALMRGMGFEV